MSVLVAYDGSRPAKEAVEHAIDEYDEEEIVLLRVIEGAGGSTDAGLGLAKEKLKQFREEASASVSADLDELFDTDGVEIRIETTFGKPAREIVSFAEDDEIEHIVAGSHGREGISRIFLGSVAEKVTRRATVPVTVVR
jgi:nucleotide-binding universal stress UspA family protein